MSTNRVLTSKSSKADSGLLSTTPGSFVLVKQVPDNTLS